MTNSKEDKKKKKESNLRILSVAQERNKTTRAKAIIKKRMLGSCAGWKEGLS